MSQLLVVRHGQAGFDREDYDQLSDAGARQAALLGQWLSAGGHVFETVARGAMVRHRETLAGIRRGYDEAGTHLPEAVCLQGLDEFDHKDVLAAFAQAEPRHPDAVALAAGRAGDPRAIYRYLRAALLAWSEARLDSLVHEPWGQFRARVRGAADELAQLAERGHVLVVTSGGVMAQLAAIALDLPDASAVDLNLAIRTSAISEFHAIDGDLRLASWNNVPHLAAPEHRKLWTHY